MIGTLITIGTDGSKQRQPIQDDGRGNAGCIVAAVGGDFDMVPKFRTYEGQRADAYVNGDGIRTMPPNSTATLLWHAQSKFADTMVLHGPMAIVIGDDEFMDAQL